MNEHSKKIKILIAEDDVVVATNLSVTLNELGYEVVDIVDTGEEVLQLLAKTLPDLLLLDIDLAGKLTGIETADLIHAKYKVPFIYLTAHGDRETINKAKFTEPAAYLVKPFDDRTLLSAIEVAVYKSAHISEESTQSVQPHRYKFEDSIFVKSKNRLQKLLISEVLWVEASDIYSLLITEHSKYIINYALKIIDDKLPQDHFMRVHRSFIVNLNAIEALEGHQLVISGRNIPVGKTYRDKLMQRLEII